MNTVHTHNNLFLHYLIIRSLFLSFFLSSCFVSLIFYHVFNLISSDYTIFPSVFSAVFYSSSLSFSCPRLLPFFIFSSLLFLLWFSSSSPLALIPASSCSSFHRHVFFFLSYNGLCMTLTHLLIFLFPLPSFVPDNLSLCLFLRSCLLYVHVSLSSRFLSSRSFFFLLSLTHGLYLLSVRFPLPVSTMVIFIISDYACNQKASSVLCRTTPSMSLSILKSCKSGMNIDPGSVFHWSALGFASVCNSYSAPNAEVIFIELLL